MKSSLLSFFKYLPTIVVLIVAFGYTSTVVLATHTGNPIDHPPTVQAGDETVSLDKVTLENPLNGINSIEGLLVALLNIVMVLMVPVIVFFIIYAGFKYVMAQGNASQVEEATRALTYAVIGGVLILAALAIAEIIKNVVAAF